MRPFVALVCCVLLACDRAPSAEGLPEWKPTDHDRLADQEQQRQAQREQAQQMPAGHPRTDAGPPPSASVDAGAALGTAELAELAWNSQCVTCHGPNGRGDGPQAPMLHPPDFGSKEWQDQRTDAELIASIQNGKNKMPKFGLPERVVSALVARVRGYGK